MHVLKINAGKYLYINQTPLYRIYIPIYRYHYNDTYLYKGLFKKIYTGLSFVKFQTLANPSAKQLTKANFDPNQPTATYCFHNLLKKPSSNTQQNPTMNRVASYAQIPPKMPLVCMANEKYFCEANHAT